MATLIISEKPQAASRIAYALSDGNFEKKSVNKAPWFEFSIGNEKFYVAPAVGHLFTLSQKESGWDYPRFDVEWIATFEKDKKAGYAKKYFNNLKALAKKCDKFIVSTDYDVEGEVIAWNILEFICRKEDAKRMKFSTLTYPELKNSFKNLMPHLDKGQVNAGLLRHTLDWFWGINTSRALMASVKKNNRYFTLSIGRVQGPTLEILTEKEKEIKKFISEPYWQILLYSGEIRAFYIDKKIIEKKKAVEIYEECLGENAKVDRLEKNKYRVFPPTPFNLTDLQREAYRVFKISPSQTLKIASNLYLNGLISYPRTSSQKLPQTIGYKKVMEELKKIGYEKQVSLLNLNNLRPREGSKSDPAHPAIYPTGHKSVKLGIQDKKIYDLIVKRFLSTFSTPAVREKMELILKIKNKYNFVSEGHRMVEEGWTEIYKPYAHFKEAEFPILKAGQVLDVDKFELLEKETEPPKRYTPSSLIAELEKRNLGTKTTRSEIIESLYSRQYIQGVPIEVTDLGIKVCETLEKYAPEVVSEDLTREFEKEMEEVSEQKKTKEEVIEAAKKNLTKILEKFKKMEKEIGEGIVGSIDETRKKERIVGKCNLCGGELRVIVSKASGKRFVGCENYSKGCKNSYPLPQGGLLKITDEICKTCQAPIVKIITRGKRPWELCINIKCPSKEKKEK